MQIVILQESESDIPIHTTTEKWSTIGYWSFSIEDLTHRFRFS